MPKPPKSRTNAKATKKVPVAVVPTEREPRGARRKRETRSRLLEAALHLMAERGMEGVTINEITEAADVGFGSFYNHFESKEVIYAALMDSVFEEFADAIDRLVREIADPAEVIAVSIRHTILRARREPVWGKFLIREGFSARVLERGLGQRLLRDIQKGVVSKRFKITDPLVTFVSAGGTVLATISAELLYGASASASKTVLKNLGFSGDGLPERAAAVILKILGIDAAETEIIAHRPLPVVELES